MIIGVGGCVASQEGVGLTERAPFVDLVFGPQTLHRLPAMIDELRAKGHPVVDVSFPEIEKFDRLPEPQARGATAFVSVMEGCSKYCTFCVVPYTRGEEISRPLEQVIEELRRLAAQGVSEITLLGQNVNAYRGTMAGGGHADLAALIYFVAEVPGVERIRFTTSHPVEFRDSLIEASATCRSSRTICTCRCRAARTAYCADEARLHRPRVQAEAPPAARRPARTSASRATSSSAFPDETEDDFEPTLDLDRATSASTRRIPLSTAARPGTPAAALPATCRAK